MFLLVRYEVKHTHGTGDLNSLSFEHFLVKIPLRTFCNTGRMYVVALLGVPSYFVLEALFLAEKT